LEYLTFLVRPTYRFSINFNNALGQIDQPGLRNAGSGIKRQLDIPVVFHGGISYLDNDQHVVWCWVSRIEVVSRLEYCYVRLWFRVAIDGYWVLYAQDGRIAQQARQ